MTRKAVELNDLKIVKKYVNDSQSLMNLTNTTHIVNNVKQK